jgi:branched-subunit amino acid aminotransferase/4-amino-4-deoxychorismate lyase
LLPVGEIAGHAYKGAPGPVTQRLDKEFSAYVQEYLSKQALAAR